MNTVILDDIKIDRILRRIAYQIVENCHGQDHIVIVGIKPRGVWVRQ
jgi:pyrimidine operon attenuation protein/uracil phosphoribosyltransferase